jgi:hypothetical protein
MAFQNVDEKSNYKKLTELKTGESITGYVVGIEESTRLAGAWNLLMNIDGKRFSVSVAGNVKYLCIDKKLQVGPMTRITRKEDEKSKGKVATRYKVEQDLEDVIAGTEFVQQAPKVSMADKLASLKG